MSKLLYKNNVLQFTDDSPPKPLIIPDGSVADDCECCVPTVYLRDCIRPTTNNWQLTDAQFDAVLNELKLAGRIDGSATPQSLVGGSLVQRNSAGHPVAPNGYSSYELTEDVPPNLMAGIPPKQAAAIDYDFLGCASPWVTCPNDIARHYIRNSSPTNQFNGRYIGESTAGGRQVVNYQGYTRGTVQRFFNGDRFVGDVRLYSCNDSILSTGVNWNNLGPTTISMTAGTFAVEVYLAGLNGTHAAYMVNPLTNAVCVGNQRQFPEMGVQRTRFNSGSGPGAIPTPTTFDLTLT